MLEVTTNVIVSFLVAKAKKWSASMSSDSARYKLIVQSTAFPEFEIRQFLLWFQIKVVSWDEGTMS